MSSPPQWQWSAQYQNYYFVTYDANGQPVFTWASQSSSATDQLERVDSLSPTQSTTQNDQPEMPTPVPYEIRATLPRFIAGTPHTGYYDLLDSSYRMRTGREAHQFFKRGRVFATLFSEATSGTARPGRYDDAYTTVRFGESVYTQIRRFVVVSVRQYFVYACAIATYSGHGTLKRGCNPREHAIIYNTGVHPSTCYLAGEWEAGLQKDPIEVTPADDSSHLTPTSRIRFGKVYSIEWNIKVKDIGMVVDSDMSKLLAYWAAEDREMYSTG